jgi:hypothetical protein
MSSFAKLERSQRVVNEPGKLAETPDWAACTPGCPFFGTCASRDARGYGQSGGKDGRDLVLQVDPPRMVP